MHMISSKFKYEYIGAEGYSRYLDSGDSGFDNQVLIHDAIGGRAQAVLNKNAREKIIGLMQKMQMSALDIDNGVISASFYGMYSGFSGMTLKILDPLLDAVTILVRPGKPFDLLCENFLKEKSDKVRLSILKTMYNGRYKLEKNSAVAKSAFRMKNPEIRFEAVKLVGEEEYSSLMGLYNEGMGLLKQKILKFVIARQTDVMLGFFLDPENQPKGGELARDLARYFEVLKAEQAEPWLLGLVGKYYQLNEELGSAVIHALSICGGYTSIAALDKIRTASNNRQVDSAIARIQDRIGAGDAGWLTLQTAEKEEGLLSLEEEKISE